MASAKGGNGNTRGLAVVEANVLEQSFEGIQWKQTWEAQKLPSPHLLLSAFHGTSLLLLPAKYFAIQVLS